MSRVVMFVFNDCRTDSRVLREAGSLAAAGHDVTIIARPTDAASTVGEREEHDGFAIVRVPIPPGHRLFRLWLRYPWRITNWAIPRARRGFGRMPGGLADLGIAALAILASAPLSVVRGPFYLRARYRNRTAAEHSASSSPAAESPATKLPTPTADESPGAIDSPTADGSPAWSPTPAPDDSPGAIEAPATATEASPIGAPSPGVERTAMAEPPTARRAPWRRPSPVEWLVRWRWVITAWARSAAAAAGPADVYHGHDLTGLAAAIAAAQIHAGARIVYDSHEIYLESGANADQPAWLRRLMVRLERRWIGACVALVTVNDSLAEELGRRYQPVLTIVVHNCPPRSEAPTADTGDLIRAATGIPPDQPIALYHGAFSRHRGLEQLAEAVNEPGLERVHAVFLGYGGMRADLDALAAGPTAPGRIHVLSAVPPDELGRWVASADVGVMVIQPSTLNHRMSTPNKLFECLAAGIPVVASDFPEMRRIVCGDPAGPLGRVVRPDDVPGLAAAIRSIVTASPADRAALRDRCRQAASERWNWETESARLVRLYAGLVESS
ncbi:MAG: glycosyltransferase [Chloroflexi bacterium]|nr:glycosyltransferase [Chloroflexota bacterium]